VSPGPKAFAGGSRGWSRLFDSVANVPELIPGLLAVGVMIAWALAQAGAFPTSSAPGGLFILGLLVTVAIVFRRSLRALPRPTLLAIAFAAAFVVWSFLSIGWADVKGDAWDGANRALLYFTVFALFALAPWRPRAAATVLGAFALAIAAVAGVTFLKASGAAHPELFFISGAFSEPTGYHNADAALFLLGFFPALFLASRRETPWPVRGVMLAAAGLLLQLALLPQSRGALVVFPVAAALYLALVPGRARTLIAAIPLMVATALTAGPILDVFSAANGGSDLGAALHGARQAMVMSFVALLAVGLALALVDRELSVSERATRLANRGLGALGVAATVVGAIVVIAVIGNPFSWASARWHDVKSGYPAQGFDSSRLGGSLGSNRYDFWRVSANELSGSPLTGVGSANFAADYLRQRHSAEEPSDPHSLPLAIVAQTGLVGGALFAGFVVSALFCAGRVRWRDGAPLGRGLAAVSVVVFAYWLLHSSGDWFWTLPALSAPAFAFLALAGRIDAPRGVPRAGARRESRSPWRGRARIAAAAFAVAFAVVFAAVSYTLPWAAARDVQIAASSWSANPQRAFDRLDQARNWNPLSAQPDLVAGAIAERLGDRTRMRASFTRALGRDSDNWYALLELGALDALEGRRGSALAQLRSAARLDPREPLIRSAIRGVQRGHPISLRSIDRVLLSRTCSLVGRTNQTRFCRG
jgi:O-antigen ligase/polysaccharide polymerase Wzy-like membrane protein